MLPTPNQNLVPNFDHRTYTPSKTCQQKSLKLEFPQYNGDSNVLTWLNQVQQVLLYHEAPEQEWVQICTFYLRNEAMQWYSWYSTNVDHYKLWPVFQAEIKTRFGPPEMYRPFDSFANLKQTTTVRAYLNQFEHISGMLDKLHPSYIIDQFIGGLKEETRYEVLAARPQFLRDALISENI